MLMKMLEMAILLMAAAWLTLLIWCGEDDFDNDDDDTDEDDNEEGGGGEIGMEIMILAFVKIKFSKMEVTVKSW